MTTSAQDQARRIKDRIQADPVWFCRTFLGLHLWSKQREILESVRDNNATAVRSGHGVGKTTTAAAAVLWFLAAFGPEAIVVTTAPVWRQVRDLLWREIRKMHHRSGGFFDGNLSETKLDFAPEWYAVGLSTNQPENFQGYHSPHLLFVVDEASGVSQSIFEAAEGFLTAAGSRSLYIGNPTQVGGEFYAAFHSQRALYTTITVSAFDTPAFTDEKVPEHVARVLPSREWVERMKTKYRVSDEDERGGTGVRLSPVYEVRVLGRFPSQGSKAVVPMFQVENAQAREQPMPTGELRPESTDELRALYEGTWPTVIGCDVARFGCFDDQTELLTDEGWKFFEDVRGDERVLTLNGDVAEWGEITQVHRYPYVGPMNLYDGTKVNFCITDNHRLVSAPAFHARTDREEPIGWRIARYDELANEFLIRRSSTWEGVHPGDFTFRSWRYMRDGRAHLGRQDVFSAEDWFEFLGWFVAEGNVYQEKRVNGRLRVLIAQRPGPKSDRIRAMLDRMGISYRMTASHQFEFTSRPIGEHLMEACGIGAGNKRVPRYVKEAPPALIERFLDSYCDGDGSRRNGRRQTYGTSSTLLADDIQEMLVKIGRAGKLARRYEAGSVATIEGRTITRTLPGYTVTEVSRERPGTVNKSKVERVHYAGYVHCVSTPLKTIMVRRKGSTMWSGNSDMTCITLRQGNRVRIVEVINGQDTMATAGSLAKLARENHHPLYGKPTIAIDDTGVGGGVTDRLREIARDDPEGAAWSRVVAFNGGNSPAEANKREYPNARSELWFEFAEEWLPDLDLDDDEDLLSELCAPEYEMNSKGQRVVEPKAETKKRIGYSPDRADAVMVAFCRGVSAAHSTVAPSGPVTPGGSRWAGMGGASGGRSKWR